MITHCRFCNGYITEYCLMTWWQHSIWNDRRRRNHFQNPLYLRMSKVRRWTVFPHYLLLFLSGGVGVFWVHVTMKTSYNIWLTHCNRVLHPYIFEFNCFLFSGDWVWCCTNLVAVLKYAPDRRGEEGEEEMQEITRNNCRLARIPRCSMSMENRKIGTCL